MNNKLIIIAGPTASGKSSIAIQAANMLNTEIISCDSMQIYKGMDIGTAKVSKFEQSQAKHHMIDIINPDQEFSVSEYSSKALEIIDRMHLENKTPILCGGTGLYIDALLYPLSFIVDKDDNYRNELNELVLKNGPEFIHDMLKEIDPKEAEKVHYNNVKRVIRALEIYKLTGKTKSELDERERPLRFDTLLIAMNPERDELYERINKRVDEMFDNGLIDEVQQLLDCGYSFSLQSMQAIGYKEFEPYVLGNISLDMVKDEIKVGSRNYAKRQITWLKRYPFTQFVNPNNKDEILNKIKVFSEE